MVQPAVLNPPVTDTWRLGAASAALMGMIGFEPTGEEQAAILRCRKRFKLVVGGGQAGKSLEACADWVVHLYEDKARHAGEPLLYWLVAADYDRTKREFEYLGDFLLKLGMPLAPGSPSKRVDPGFIEVQYPKERKPSILIETKSGKDPRTLSMYSPHGIIICEASQIDPETYVKCWERVTASGGWLHMSGTYEYGSKGWFPGVAAAWTHGSEDSQSFKLPSPTNKYLYPGGINDPKIQRLKREASDAFFLERIMGEAAPPKGIVFGEARADIHIRPVEHDLELPLYLWEDPGYGHAHALLAAQIAPGGQIRVFDEIFERGKITEEIIDIALHREWWKNTNKTLVIDPNYAHQHQGTHSVAEIWLAKTQLATIGVKVGIEEGIERLHGFLKVNPLTGAPGIVFNPRCKGVLSELGLCPSPFSPPDQPRWEIYSKKTDREGNILDGPPNDKFCDGIKAAIYGIVEHFGLVTNEGSSFFPMKRHGIAQPDSDLRGSVLDGLRGIRPRT